MTYRATRIACYVGYIVQAIVNNFLPLLFVMFNTDYGITYAQLSFVILLNFGVQLITDIASIKIVARFGTRRSVIGAHFLCATGLLLLSFLPRVIPSTFVGICISVLFYSVGGGLIEVLISPIIDRVSQGSGKAAMSFLHSFYCWGQILVVAVTTLLIRIAGSGVWQVASVFWAVIPFVNAFLLMRVPMAQDTQEDKSPSVKRFLQSRLFIVFIFIMFSAGASELAMSQWASTFAEQGLGLSKLKGDLLGPCAFAFLMGVGRIAASFLAEKISVRKLLTVCSVITAASYLAASLIDNGLIAVIACAVCGFGVSFMWPGLYSLAIEYFPSAGNAMFGLLAMAGDMGCSLGPWTVGIVAGFGGLKTALLVATVFPLISLFLLFAKSFNTTGEEKE